MSNANSINIYFHIKDDALKLHFQQSGYMSRNILSFDKTKTRL
jgi:hypothetical protein